MFKLYEINENKCYKIAEIEQKIHHYEKYKFEEYIKGMTLPLEDDEEYLYQHDFPLFLERYLKDETLKKHLKVQNCLFEYKCPEDWNKFDKTDDRDIRYCDICQTNVYNARTYDKYLEYSAQKKCIMIDDYAGATTMIGNPTPLIFSTEFFETTLEVYIKKNGLSETYMVLEDVVRQKDIKLYDKSIEALNKEDKKYYAMFELQYDNDEMSFLDDKEGSKFTLVFGDTIEEIDDKFKKEKELFSIFYVEEIHNHLKEVVVLLKGTNMRDYQRDEIYTV